MDTDPKIFAEAEERVTELVSELERIKGATSQIETAESRLGDASQRIEVLSGIVAQLSEELTNLGSKLQDLRPELIVSQLQEILDLIAKANVDRSKLSRLVQITLVAAVVSAIGALIIVFRSF